LPNIVLLFYWPSKNNLSIVLKVFIFVLAYNNTIMFYCCVDWWNEFNDVFNFFERTDGWTEGIRTASCALACSVSSGTVVAVKNKKYHDSRQMATRCRPNLTLVQLRRR